MITLTKTINKLPKNPLLKTNKGEHRFEMNIKTRTGNPQQTTPQAPYFLHFFFGGGLLGGPHIDSGLKQLPRLQVHQTKLEIEDFSPSAGNQAFENLGASHHLRNHGKDHRRVSERCCEMGFVHPVPFGLLDCFLVTLGG